MSTVDVRVRTRGARPAPLRLPPTLMRPRKGRPLLLDRNDTGLETLSDPVRRHATWAWVFLLMSVLPWSFAQTGRITVFPKRVEQVLVAVLVAIAGWFALKVNRRFRIAHAWPVLLYALLAVVALLPPLGGEAGLGSLFRASRFLATLLLLVLLMSVAAHDRYVPLRAYVAVMKMIVVITIAGLVTGYGFDGEGRLITQLPALTAPGLAQWTALFSGILAFLMLQRAVPLRWGLGWLSASMLCLILSHSRTPLVAGGAAFVAGLAAMFVSSQRARRLVSWTLFFVPVAALLFGPAVQSWFLRGQDQDQLNTLTGRTKAWAKVYAFPRDVYTRWFGVGLTDKSIEGLSIDSGYLSIYHEQGRIGIALMVLIFVVYLARILARRPSLPRAVALFLVVYVLIASYTETGIGDMSSYVLHLVVAMILVVVPVVPAVRPGAPADGAEAR